MKKRVGAVLLLLLFVWVGQASAEKEEELKPVPKAYADKHMPKGWWTDAAIIKEGQRLFETAKHEIEDKRAKKMVKIEKGCLTCHAIDKAKDRPVTRGAQDFRAEKAMNRFSDAYWFWRVSEGVPKTKMPAWKEKLTEEERWKVIAYEHTWSHGSKPADHTHKEIVVSVEP